MAQEWPKRDVRGLECNAETRAEVAKGTPKRGRPKKVAFPSLEEFASKVENLIRLYDLGNSEGELAPEAQTGCHSIISSFMKLDPNFFFYAFDGANPEFPLHLERQFKRACIEIRNTLVEGKENRDQARQIIERSIDIFIPGLIEHAQPQHRPRADAFEVIMESFFKRKGALSPGNAASRALETLKISSRASIYRLKRFMKTRKEKDLRGSSTAFEAICARFAR